MSNPGCDDQEWTQPTCPRPRWLEEICWRLMVQWKRRALSKWVMTCHRLCNKSAEGPINSTVAVSCNNRATDCATTVPLTAPMSKGPAITMLPPVQVTNSKVIKNKSSQKIPTKILLQRHFYVTNTHEIKHCLFHVYYVNFYYRILYS